MQLGARGRGFTTALSGGAVWPIRRYCSNTGFTNRTLPDPLNCFSGKRYFSIRKRFVRAQE